MHGEKHPKFPTQFRRKTEKSAPYMSNTISTLAPEKVENTEIQLMQESISSEEHQQRSSCTLSGNSSGFIGNDDNPFDENSSSFIGIDESEVLVTNPHDTCEQHHDNTEPDGEHINFMPHYRTRLQERNMITCNSRLQTDETTVQPSDNEQVDDDTTETLPTFINLTTLQNEILLNRERFTSAHHDAAKTSEDASSRSEHNTWNAAELAVRQFIAQYNPPSSSAGNEMLKLIKFLTDEKVIEHSRRLPLTLDTLYNRDDSLKTMRKRSKEYSGDSQECQESKATDAQNM